MLVGGGYLFISNGRNQSSLSVLTNLQQRVTEPYRRISYLFSSHYQHFIKLGTPRIQKIVIPYSQQMVHWAFVTCCISFRNRSLLLPCNDTVGNFDVCFELASSCHGHFVGVWTYFRNVIQKEGLFGLQLTVSCCLPGHNPLL